MHWKVTLKAIYFVLFSKEITSFFKSNSPSSLALISKIFKKKKKKKVEIYSEEVRGGVL